MITTRPGDNSQHSHAANNATSTSTTRRRLLPLAPGSLPFAAKSAIRWRLLAAFIAIALVATAVCVRAFRVEASSAPASANIAFRANSPVGKMLNSAASQSQQFSMLRSLLMPGESQQRQRPNAPLAGEVTLTATAGTATGTFTTLKDAFDAINAGTHQGVIAISINANTTEAASAVLNASLTGPAVYTSISIQPAGGAARTISGSIAGHLIDLNGADNVTIDGLNTGGNSLTIDNTTSGTSSTAIRFIADATTNTITNCTIKSAETSVTLGTVFLSTGIASGNTGNVISNNTITSSGANFATNAIYSLGTSAAVFNSGTISGNNIQDYFNAGAVSNGILLAATGNSAWTISNNKLFQTATRVYTATITHNGISILTGAGYTISGNTIGFANSSGTGTTNMLGNTGVVTGTFPTSYTVAVGTAVTIKYIAINAAFTAAGTVSNIQGNTVAGIALYSSSGAGTTNGILCGINVTSGNANIGTTTANTIGSTTGQSSLYAINSSGGGAVVGIFATSANTVSIQNNTIGAVDSVGTTATFSGAFTGIDTAGTGVFTISSNFVGNTTTDNIRTGFTQTAGSLSNTGTLVSTTGTTSPMVGVRSSATGATLTMSSNTLRGWVNGTTAGGVLTGITSTGAITSSVAISSNALGTSGLGWMRYAFANTNATGVTGINASAIAAAATLTISSNDFRGITYSVSGTGPHTYITWAHAGSVTDNINSNTFTNLNVNTTGSVTFFTRSGSMTATGVENVNNNSIVSAFNKGGAGGSIVLYNGVGSSVTGSTMSNTGNNFSNITVTGATSISGWLNQEGLGVTGGPAKTITGNTFSNWTGGTSSITVLSSNFGGNGVNVSNNTISGVTYAPTATGTTLTGLSIGASNFGATQTYANNSISGLSSTSTGGQVIGILGGSTTITTLNINNNAVSGISSTSTAGPIVAGIFNQNTGTTVNIFKNKIYDIVCSPGAVIGINSTATAVANTINVSNNIVGRLYASTSAFFQAARGLLLQSTVAATFNVYFNTVYLDGATLTQTYCVYIGGATANVPNVNAIDNIFVNNVTSSNGSTLPNTAYFRLGTTTATNLASTTNNNLLYGGTPAVDHLIYVDGAVGALTNPQQTLASYKTFVTPRESASKTELPPFLNTATGSLANYLHISSLATQVKGGGIPITGFTDDFDGDTRNASTPDMGADEVTSMQFSSATYSVAENVGGGLVTITVTRTAGTGNAATVQYATSDGSTNPATGGATCSGATDYVNTSGTLNFAAADTSKTFTIPICPDTTFEADETVNLTLTTATGSILGTPNTAVLTITNDDTAPTFAIGDVTQVETDSGTTNFVFTVTKTGSTALDSVITYSTNDGSATQPSDYTAVTGGTTTILAANPSGTITISVNGDTTYEANETFTVDGTNVTNGSFTDASGLGTITNDDAIPATLVVNSTNDPGTGICDLAECTLREAINLANANADATTINFAIPGEGVRTISPTSALPTITTTVIIDGYSQPLATANTLAVGDNANLLIELDGTSAGGGSIGLDFSSTAGSSAVRGLVINRFGLQGIRLTDNSNCAVAGNFIGTNAAGTSAAGNNYGVFINGANGTTIGGTTAADRNIISGASGGGAQGVQIEGTPATPVTGNIVKGNYIGTNAAGTAAIPNGGDGIRIESGDNTVIGGTAALEANVIAGNDIGGIRIRGAGTVVKGNFIGTNSAGAVLGNGDAGIQIVVDGSNNNVIGGTGSGEANIIANSANGKDGIFVQNGTGNVIRGNSIHDNTGLGIDLTNFGVDLNDDQDPDGFANNTQNFPVLSSATVTGSTKTITGNLNSTPGQTFTLDFYNNATCNGSTYGEGQTYVGSMTTGTTDGSGNVLFTFHPATLSPGDIITATATDSSGNTSEFSQCKPVGAGSPGDIQFTSATYTVGEAGPTAAITVTRVGGSDGAITANFSTSNGSAIEPGDYTAVTSFPISYIDGETGPKTVFVTINEDLIYEGDETVNLSLDTTVILRPQGINAPPVGPHSATLTITDNDTAPTFSIDDVLHLEGSPSGTTSYVFTVTKTGSTAVSSSVNFTTQDGSATLADSDYAFNSGTLNFTAVQTTQQITVLVNKDTNVESDEDFNVHLDTAVSATISDADGTGTITNDDSTLSFAIDDVTLAEGTGAGTTAFTFTVTKTGSAGTSSVDFTTQDGTATLADNDYQTNSGTLNFGPTDTSMPITVLVNKDAAFEGDETFNVNLFGAVNASISDADGTGTITNDDTCAAFATVYVDDSWVGTAIGSDPDGGGPATIFGCDSFATIQGGINAVTSGGTVIVNDGTYIENVTIPKALTLTGAGAATVTLLPAISDPNCDGSGGGSLCGVSNLILVQANNVTISGLTLDGDNPGLPGGINVGGANVDARNGIITDHNTGIFENLVVHDVTVKNVFLRGIYASSGGSFNFHHNTVQNVAGDSASSIAMFNFGGVGIFDNNTVLDSNDGIASNASLGTQYTNNQVSNCASGGIHTDNAGDGPIVSNDLISANIVDNSPVGGFGIYAYEPRATVTIQNNTVTNVDNGLASFGRLPSTGSLPSGNIKEGAAQSGGSATARPRVIDVREPGAFFLTHRAVRPNLPADISPDATVFTGNTVNGQNKANSTGVTLTTDQLGNGSGSAGITFNQNTVIANVTGFKLEAQPTFTLTVKAAFNRLVPTTTAFNTINNTGTLSATMENNWWGCNAGPGNIGCGAISGTGVGVDFNPWIVLGVSASPSSIPPFTNSNITADMTRNSNSAPAGGTLPDIPVAWSAVNGTMSPTNGTVVASTASSTFTSTSTSNGSACAMVDNQLTCTGVTIFPLTVTIVPAPTPTAADNDYTRINNAVQATFNGQTIKLLGTFNWTEPFAAASWSRGSNDIAGDLDDYSILVPANLNNVTFTADNLGDGTIQGPGDLPGLDLEGVFFFDSMSGSKNQNWTISNIQFLDFDLSIGMFQDTGGVVDAFNNTHLTNNYIRMARDVATATDTVQNIAIHYSFGTNQLISGNTIDIQGDGVTVGGNFASDVGMQSNTSGGNVYNGLQITNNTIHVLHAQSANPELILGIWENSSGHTSNITVSGNSFTNVDLANSPATNIQRGFRVTSHSSATTTVTYQNNTVSGANIGFQWLAGSDFSGNLPVVVKSNTITGNNTGVKVDSQGSANLSFNRIVGNTVTGLNNASSGTVTAENNWWGCNAGPGFAGCDAVTGVADFDPWLVLGVSAVPSSMNPGGTSTVTADMRFNSIGSNTSGDGTLPLIPVAFTATQGTMTPPASTITSGTAVSTFTSTSGSSGTACAMVDNQQICTPITVNAPSFTINDVTHNEGNGPGTTAYTFTITKTGATALNASVDYETVNGSATAPSDFTAITTTNVVFLPADTTKQFTVLVNGDTTFETNEAFTVHLSNAVNAAIADADGTGTITNDDAQPTLSINNVSLNEGDIGTTDFAFTVTKAGNATELPVTVNFATADGVHNGSNTGATGGAGCGPGVDYVSQSSSLTFLPNETTMTIHVSVCGDPNYENNELFFVNLSGPSNATIVQNPGTGTIKNDDPVTTVSIDDVTAFEGDSGTTNFVFTVTKTGPTELTTTVHAKTADGSATSPSDYTAIADQLITFPPSSSNDTQTVTVVVNGDTTNEPDELFFVSLFNVSNANIGHNPGVGTIQNDDARTISGRVTYADPGTPVKNTTMSLSAPSFTTRVTVTDVNGDYSFTGVPVGNNYTVTPSKPGDANNIESFDAAKVARFVAGLDVPTANQVIASDADNDGILTSFDAVLIARFVAGLPNTGIVGTWKFVPVNRTYTALATNQTNQNYTAILVGETSGNWVASIPLGGGDDARVAPQIPDATLAVTVSLPNVTGPMLSIITVPITVGDVTGQGVKSYDLQVSFNSAIVIPDTTPTDTAGTLSSGMLITPNAMNSGHLIVSAFQTGDLAGSGTLIKLRFMIVGTPGQVTPTTFADYTDPGTIFHPGFRFNAGIPAAVPTNGSIHVNGPTATAGTVSGRVTDETGRPVSGVVITLNGTQSRKTITDVDGNYRFDDV